MLTISTHALALNKFGNPPTTPLTGTGGSSHHGVPLDALVVDEPAGVSRLEFCEPRLRGNLAEVRFSPPPDWRTLGAVPEPLPPPPIGPSSCSISTSIETRKAGGRLPDAESIGRVTAMVSAPRFRRPVTEFHSIVVGCSGNELSPRQAASHGVRIVLRHFGNGGRSE